MSEESVSAISVGKAAFHSRTFSVPEEVVLFEGKIIRHSTANHMVLSIHWIRLEVPVPVDKKEVEGRGLFLRNTFPHSSDNLTLPNVSQRALVLTAQGAQVLRTKPGWNVPSIRDSLQVRSSHTIRQLRVHKSKSINSVISKITNHIMVLAFHPVLEATNIFVTQWSRII